MDDLQTLFPEPKSGVKRPAVWRDKAGVVHRAVGAEVHRGIRLMWTACGKKDIPSNAAWLQNDETVTCDGCQLADKAAEASEHEEELANG